MRPGETQCQSNWKSLQTFSVSLMVNLHKIEAELFDSISAVPVLCTFVQHSITSCSLLEVASDIIFGVVVGEVGLRFHFKICQFSTKTIHVIRPAHLTTNNKLQQPNEATNSITYLNSSNFLWQRLENNWQIRLSWWLAFGRFDKEISGGCECVFDHINLEKQTTQFK